MSATKQKPNDTCWRLLHDGLFSTWQKYGVCIDPTIKYKVQIAIETLVRRCINVIKMFIVYWECICFSFRQQEKVYLQGKLHPTNHLAAFPLTCSLISTSGHDPLISILSRGIDSPIPIFTVSHRWNNSHSWTQYVIRCIKQQSYVKQWSMW